MPELGDGQLLVRTLWLSFDPTQRGWMSMDTYVPMIPLGELMRAIGVGQVVEPPRSGFAKGDLLQGCLGWQEYVIVATGVLLGANAKVPPARLRTSRSGSSAARA